MIIKDRKIQKEKSRTQKTYKDDLGDANEYTNTRGKG